jgi:hypothetical protein
LRLLCLGLRLSPGSFFALLHLLLSLLVLKRLLDTLGFENTCFAIELGNPGCCGFGLGSNPRLAIRALSLQQVCEFLRLGNARADVCVGPVVILKRLEVIVFALEECLGGDLGVGLYQGLLVDVEIDFGKALV